MIYVCIPSHNEAPTIGLLLWRIRQVFTAFPREYQLLVADDASTDATSDVLEPYNRVLPLQVVRHAARRGRAASVEELLRIAVERTDRPKRDCAIILDADFAHSPDVLPELVKEIEGGADLVVAEGEIRGEPTRGHRLFRQWAPRVLRGAVRVPGIHDVVSGFVAIRLIALKQALRMSGERLLTTEGWVARAELLAKVARHARRIESVRSLERYDLRQRESRLDPWPATVELWKARRILKAIPRTPVEPSPEREKRAVS